jgi:hypothetical protein
MDIATDTNPKTVKLLNPRGVNGSKNEIINIIKLEKIPLTPPIKIHSSLSSLTYSAANPATILDKRIPNPEDGYMKI